MTEPGGPRDPGELLRAKGPGKRLNGWVNRIHLCVQYVFAHRYVWVQLNDEHEAPLVGVSNGKKQRSRRTKWQRMRRTALASIFSHGQSVGVSSLTHTGTHTRTVD